MTPQRTPVALLVAVVLASALLYGLTVTNLITQDSITYAASAVRAGLAGWLHPHHLIYNVLLAGALRLFGTLRPDDAALAVMQGFNVVASAIGVGAMLALLMRLGLARGRALLTTALFATSNGYWLYSSQIEVYNLAVLFALLALFSYVVATERERSSPRWTVIGIVASALALLSHQTAIFLLFGFGVHGLFLLRGRERAVRLATYVVAPLALVGVLYLCAAWYVTGELGPAGVLRFATSYAHTGQWGIVSAKNFVKAPVGLLSGFIAVGEGVTSLAPGAIAPLEIAAILLFLAGAALLLWALVRRRAEDAVERRHRALLVVLSAWLVAHAAFVWWWHPANIEFWIIAVPALLVAAAIAWPCVERAGRLAYAGMATMLVAQLVANVPPIIEGTTAASPRIDAARSVARLTRERDLLLVTSHPGMVGFYQYYSDADLLFPFPAALGDAGTIDRSLDSLSTRVDDVLHRRARVVLEGDPMLVPGSDELRPDAERQAIERWLNRYEWAQQSVGGGSVLVLERPSTSGPAIERL
jgi:hypothetical protein